MPKNQGLSLIFEAMAYALAGMFLLAGLVDKSTVLIVLGGVFMAFAVTLIVAAILNKPFQMGGKFGWLAFPLFMVTWVEFFIEAVKPEDPNRNIYILLAVAFLILVAVGLGFVLCRNRKPKMADSQAGPNKEGKA